MDLVPKNELLVIEVEIQPNLIDRVSIDDVVDIRFTSFSLTPFLVVLVRLSLYQVMFYFETRLKSHITLRDLKLPKKDCKN